MQNRRNVLVGSRDNQQKPRTGKDGFLHHTCLGLVGWISYWSSGDSAENSDLAVVILVVLINTFGLTELVSDALGRHNQKEAETNTKIVDLLKLKHELDETNCRNEQQRVEDDLSREEVRVAGPQVRVGGVSSFRSGTPQWVLTTQVLRWQSSSTRASCAPRTSPSRK